MRLGEMGRRGRRGKPGKIPLSLCLINTRILTSVYYVKWIF